MIDYEKASLSDLPAIAELYQNAFPEALLAVFGKPRLPAQALVDLLCGVFALEPEGFHAAREQGRLVGFVLFTSNLHRLYRHLIFNGPLLTMAQRWVCGKYPGLSAGFIPRIAKLWWDYRNVEKGLAAPSGDGAQILSLVVDSSVQRQGIGQHLMEKALAHLRHAGISSVRLEVDAAKESAVHLYLKIGFRKIAQLPTPRGPAVVMFWYNTPR